MNEIVSRAACIVGSVVLFVGALCQAQAGGPQPERLELEFSEGTDMEAVPSPDGRYLAVQLWQQIWTVDATSGHARRLTGAATPPDEHWFPRWSPDGAFIAFSSLRTNGGLFVVSASGRKLRQLTAAEFDGWPSWSPDGRTIVFSRASGGLWTVPTSGGAPNRIKMDTLSAEHPAWSPDGRWIAFSSQGGVWVMAPDGSSVRQVTSGPDDQAPSWSPDAQHLFFVSKRSGLPQIWSVPIAGGKAEQLTNESDLYAFAPQWWPGRNVLVYTAGGKIRTLDPASGAQDSISFRAHMTLARETYKRKSPVIPDPGARFSVRGIYRPAPSPDGQSIAFAALGDLWLRHPDGKVEQLTSGPEDDVDPAWSPGGGRIAFVSNRGGDYQVWTLNVSDRTRGQVTSAPGHAETPLWHPSGESIVFAHSPRPSSRPTLSMVPSAGGTPRPILQLPAMDTRPLRWSSKDESLLFSQLYYDASTQQVKTAIKWLRTDGSVVPAGADPPEQAEFVALSPDAHKLAYVSQGELWIRSLGPCPAERRLVPGPAFFPAWSGEGSLVYVSSGKLMRVDTERGDQHQLSLDLSYEVPRPAASLLLRRARLLAPEPRQGLWDVFIKDGRIHSVRPSGQRAEVADRTLDLEGRTVIPGLFDVHRHLFRGFPAEGYLYWGVTSVAGAGEEGHWVVQQQEAIMSGRRAGPRMFPAAGFLVTSSMNAFPQFLRVKTEKQIEAYMEHLSGLGATQVKTYLRRDPWVEPAAIRAAHRRGLPVLSHFLRPAAVAAGLDRKEHAYYYTWDGEAAVQFRQDVIEILSKSRLTLSSTLVWALLQSPEGRERLKAALGQRDVSGFLTPSQIEFFRSQLEKPAPQARQFERYLRAGTANVAAAHAAGIGIVAGTDYNFVGLDVHWELELLVAAGLSPLEALRAATENAAATLGVEGNLGSIAPGAIADLVVLEADPLEDIRNTQKIHTVVQQGQIIDRAALLGNRH